MLAIGPELAVSRETEDRLRRLAALLGKWNPAINLVSKSTIGSAWDRHILDSAQLYPARRFNNWVDLGSGGGFPGVVIAIIAAELNPDARFTLVEVDQRKATFLRECARELGIAPQIITERIESVVPLGADILSARALASLDLLCGYASRHLGQGGEAVFPKGAGWRAEVEEARRNWTFTLDIVPSQTEPQAVVLKVKEIAHV